MEYLSAFESKTGLVSQYGKNKAFVVWGMGLYLDDPDLQVLADESLTDDGNDKKIDFLRFDKDSGILYIVQGTFSESPKDAAKANKASDLNAATAWLFDGDVTQFALGMQDLVIDIRTSLVNDEINQIDIIYLHNCGESKAVDDELKTAAESLKKKLKDYSIDITYKEAGNQTLERLFLRQTANMLVTDEIECPFSPKYFENDGDWSSAVLTVTGEWLRDLYAAYGNLIFSANYRGFMGINRKKINKGIQNTAENASMNFWVFNNGITILTSEFGMKGGKFVLSGMSIINGAQTTGAIGSLPRSVDLKGVKIMARVVQSTSSALIGDIVKFNNTQNKITSWDSYGNDEQQAEIQRQFKLHHYDYNYKRGFDSNNAILSIDNCIQPLLSFNGKYKDANRSKTAIFESRSLYSDAFDNVSARHILLVSCLHTAISEIKATNRTSARSSSTEKRVYELFAPLNARHYVLSILAEVILKLNGSLNDKKTMAFMPKIADGSINNYEALVSKSKGFVNLVVFQIANYDAPNEVYSHYNDTSSVASIATAVEQTISTLKVSGLGVSEVVDQFMGMLSTS